MMVVVDDQDMVRSGFAASLSAQSDIDAVGEAPNPGSPLPRPVPPRSTTRLDDVKRNLALGRPLRSGPALRLLLGQPDDLLHPVLRGPSTGSRGAASPAFGGRGRYGVPMMAVAPDRTERSAERALDRLTEVALLQETGWGRYRPGATRRQRTCSTWPALAHPGHWPGTLREAAERGDAYGRGLAEYEYGHVLRDLGDDGAAQRHWLGALTALEGTDAPVLHELRSLTQEFSPDGRSARG